MPLTMHTSRQYHPDLHVRQDWLQNEGDRLRLKYSSRMSEEQKRDMEAKIQRRQSAKAKRASGVVALTNVGIDASYSGQVSIG